MKVRSGFVSNSSSSSFIIGCGKIKDVDKLTARLHGLRYGYGISNLSDRTSLPCNVDVHCGELVVVGDGNSSPTVATPIGTEDCLYFYVSIENHEGDCGTRFYNEILGCYDYSIADNPSYFPPEQQRLISILKDVELLEGAAYRYGAERSG